ncbi:MAG: hypothetical protein U0792_08390 [Gemmataceae bacterium]
MCHDHKFDPLSMKEYYSLYSFFYSSADPALDGNVNNVGPFVKLPTPAQKTALEAAAKAEADARKQLEAAAKAAEYADPALVKQLQERRAVTDVVFDDTFPLGSSNRNTTRNAAQWIADPAFGREVRATRAAAGELVLPRGFVPAEVAAGRGSREWHV